ncbi:MAG: hypothetical protein MR364_00485 [Oscillospiraceae bacterium]|nr:hypothetical protein [Oscillospiraceae bacterium]
MPDIVMTIIDIAIIVLAVVGAVLGFILNALTNKKGDPDSENQKEILNHDSDNK